MGTEMGGRGDRARLTSLAATLGMGVGVPRWDLPREKDAQRHARDTLSPQ